jgi:hypothetical protein
MSTATKDDRKPKEAWAYVPHESLFCRVGIKERFFTHIEPGITRPGAVRLIKPWVFRR